LGIFHQTDSLRLIAFNSPGFDTDGTFLDKTSVDSLSQTAPSDSCGIAFSRGGKRYELSNHLGNVLAVISRPEAAGAGRWDESGALFLC
jgi:hypothetical protein